MHITNCESKLELKNDGKLSLFFTGTGSAFTKKLYQNNLLIVKGDDHLMIDCGTRTPEAFTELGLHITDIENYLITHSHADHVGGLEEVLLVNRYFAQKKVHFQLTKKYEKTLWNETLSGGVAYNEWLKGKPLKFRDVAEVTHPEKVSGFSREVFHTRQGSIDIHMFRTKHIPGNAKSWKDSAFSVGLVIDGKVLFTGDTQYDPEIIIELNKAFQLEAIFHDCQFFTGGVHSSLDELKQLPGDIKAKTYLMHYGDGFEDKRQEAKDAGFAGFTLPWAYYNFD